MLRRHFRILDVALTLAGPPEVVEPIAFAYRRFRVDAPDSGAGRSLYVESPDTETVAIDGKRIDLVPSMDRTGQVYHALQAALMGSIGTHAVLHAAALVEPRGRVVILAAPSGHGKSSVTLELVHRGYRFLSDDYAPLDLTRGTIEPYPRAVGLVPGGTAPIPEPFRAVARTPDDAPSLLGKTLVDVGRVLGESTLAGAAAPLGHVILLTSDLAAPAEASRTSVLVGCRHRHAEEFEGVFAETPGVRIVSRDRGPHVQAWRLELDHQARPTESLTALLDGDRVVFSEKYWEERPDFSATPEARPIKRREAAEYLGRELLNRRSGGALLTGYGGSLPRLFLDVAGALRQATCWKLQVGRSAELADLIQDRVSAG